MSYVVPALLSGLLVGAICLACSGPPPARQGAAGWAWVVCGVSLVAQACALALLLSGTVGGMGLMTVTGGLLGALGVWLSRAGGDDGHDGDGPDPDGPDDPFDWERFDRERDLWRPRTPAGVA